MIPHDQIITLNNTLLIDLSVNFSTSLVLLVCDTIIPPNKTSCWEDIIYYWGSLPSHAMRLLIICKLTQWLCNYHYYLARQREGEAVCWLEEQPVIIMKECTGSPCQTTDKYKEIYFLPIFTPVTIIDCRNCQLLRREY